MKVYTEEEVVRIINEMSQNVSYIIVEMRDQLENEEDKNKAIEKLWLAIDTISSIIQPPYLYEKCCEIEKVTRKKIVEDSNYVPSEIIEDWTHLIIQFMSAWNITESEKEQTTNLFTDYLEVVFSEGYDEGVNKTIEALNLISTDSSNDEIETYEGRKNELMINNNERIIEIEDIHILVHQQLTINEVLEYSIDHGNPRLDSPLSKEVFIDSLATFATDNSRKLLDAMNAYVEQEISK